MPPAKRHLRSTGHLCQDLQISHRLIIKAIEEHNIVPCEDRNGVAFFDDDAIEAITAAIHSLRQRGAVRPAPQLTEV